MIPGPHHISVESRGAEMGRYNINHMSWAPTSAGDLRACQGNIPHGVTSAGGTFDRVGVVSSVGPGLGGVLLVDGMAWGGAGWDGTE